MTATTKPRKHTAQGQVRPPRFFSMETLGFSDANSTWSDSPLAIPMQLQVQPAPPQATPEQLPDWTPEEVEPRLAGSNIRWSVVGTLIVLVLAALATAFWMYQRPVVEEEASGQALQADVSQLLSALPDLQELSDALLADGADIETIDISGVDLAARRLFEASGELPESATESRYLATGAAGSALDGVRLAGDARAYLLAVTPILTVPALETDPSVIALDDATRAFGDWQIGFDDVRTALPDAVLSSVTEQLDVLSGDLTPFLRDYVDALREDDPAAAAGVLRQLSSRLDQIHEQLAEALGVTQQLVTQRIDETTTALSSLQGS